jgi:type II secretory pathway pseudopilin PulG
MDRLKRNSQAGFGVIELLIAAAILVVAALSAIILVVMAISINHRNKVDSTQTMLAESVIEQVNSTIIGSGSSALTDCAGGTWTIDTAPGGAALSGSKIDYSEVSPPTDYHMQYVVNSPCTTTGVPQATYDVRWHVDIVGAPTTPTNTYLITVAAMRLGARNNAITEAGPVTLRVMAGN